MRLVMQAAIEAEVDAFLGRGRYQRREEDSAPGYRNGHQPEVAVKTTMGPVELARPKLRDTDERFCSQLFGRAVTRTSALDALVISAWVRGLSDRDVEAALAEVLGPEAALSRSTVSRICARLKEESPASARPSTGSHWPRKLGFWMTRPAVPPSSRFTSWARSDRPSSSPIMASAWVLHK